MKFLIIDSHLFGISKKPVLYNISSLYLNIKYRSFDSEREKVLYKCNLI